MKTTYPRRTSIRVPALIAMSGILLAPVHAQQQLPPIFRDTPRQIVRVHTVAEFPKNTFLENLVTTPEGLVFTSHEDGRLLRVRPGQPPTTIATLPGKVAGVAMDGAGGFVLTGTDKSRQPVVFRVSGSGTLVQTIAVPGGAFLNGIERIDARRYLIADSYAGRIWLLDTTGPRVTTWLESPLLQRQDVDNPIPAANGIRRDGDEIVVSNTARMTLLRIPMHRDGSAGEPVVWKERVNVDDFLVLPDRSLVAATHVYDSVIRIDAKGAVQVLAERAQGMTGSTAVALAADGRSVYVTTNGGMFLPPPTGVLPARILRLELPQ